MTEGLLQEVRLAEIIQLISMSEKTGKLELQPLYPPTHPRERIPVGQLFFRDGHVHAAFLADRAGDFAAENLFLWEAGFFTFTQLPAEDLPPANLHYDSQSLILRGVKRLDDWLTARDLVPTLRAVLVRSQPTPAAPLPELHTPEGQLLAQCDGVTQLIEIAPRLRMGGLRCREAAASLLADGLVKQTRLSAGEKLVRATITAALPLLGIAAELFCDDAVRAAGLAPEQLGRVNAVAVTTVLQIIQAMERAVTDVLGMQRAASLAAQLAEALGVALPAPVSNGKDMRHG